MPISTWLKFQQSGKAAKCEVFPAVPRIWDGYTQWDRRKSFANGFNPNKLDCETAKQVYLGFKCGHVANFALGH